MSKPVSRPAPAVKAPAARPAPAPQVPAAPIVNPISPAQHEQVDLNLANIVSRRGCTVSEAREFLAQQSAEAPQFMPAEPAQQPDSKGDESLL